MQGRQQPEEIGGARVELAEEDKSTSEDQGMIEEGEPDEEDFLPPPVAEEKSQWVCAITQHGRVSRFPEQYGQELKASAIVSSGLVGLATRN